MTNDAKCRGHAFGARSASIAVVFAITALFAVPVGVASASARSGLSGWLQSRFGPAHNADNRLENVLNASNVAGVTEKWKVRVSRTTWVLENNPAVLNGVAYLATWDGHLWAIDAVTGAVRWSRTLQSGTFGTAAIDGTAMYTWLASGVIRAYSLKNGRLLWSVPESNGGGTPDGSSLTLSNGVLYGGNWNGDVFARKASNGAKIWQTHVALSVFGATVVWRNEVLVVADDSAVHALNGSTGAVLWTRSLAYPEWDDPPAVGDGGLAFVVEHGAGSGSCQLDAIDARSGAIRWERHLPSPCRDAGYVALDAAHVYLATDSDDVLQVDATTGAIQWDRHLAGVAFAGGYWNRPVLANGLVYVAGSSSLWALDANTGRVRLTLATVGAFGEPVVWDGMVYTAEADDSLHAYGSGNASAVAAGNTVTRGSNEDPQGMTAARTLEVQARSHD